MPKSKTWLQRRLVRKENRNWPPFTIKTITVNKAQRQTLRTGVYLTVYHVVNYVTFTRVRNINGIRMPVVEYSEQQIFRNYNNFF